MHKAGTWALDVRTHHKAYLWIYITRVTILLAKEYEVVSTLDIWTLENKKLTSHTCLLSYLHTLNAPFNRCMHVREGADKSLAWLMSQIASLFLLQRLKGSMSGNARNLNNIETQAFIKFFFPVMLGAKGNSRHSDWNISGTCSIVCQRQ